VEFNLIKASKFPNISNECHWIDLLDSWVWGTITNNVSNGPLEYLMLNNSTTLPENPKVVMCGQILEASPQVLPMLTKVEAPIRDGAPSSNEERFPKVELKPFPFSLKYEFLGLNFTYPMIVNASLGACQVASLLRILREHRKTIGYTLVKGTHPSMCMHFILMEDDHKLLIQHQ